MKRHLLILALAGVFAALVAVDANACCHKKQACPAPATCAVVEPCPPPPPVCEPAPRHCGLFKHQAGCGHKKMFSGLCHKKPACEPVCAPVAVCETPAPVYYAAPQASGQAHASGQ